MLLCYQTIQRQNQCLECMSVSQQETELFIELGYHVSESGTTPIPNKIRLEKEVRQGDSISPKLFAACLENLRRLFEIVEGGHCSAVCLSGADDEGMNKIANEYRQLSKSRFFFQLLIPLSGTRNLFLVVHRSVIGSTVLLPGKVWGGACSIVSALYDSSDDVIQLTSSNFDSQVLNSDDLWIIEFYAPWCGHCKSLAPEYKKAAKALKGIVKIASVDCDQHRDIGGRFGVRGFPTIKVFSSNKNSPADYSGPRTADGIIDNAMTGLRNLAKERLSGGGSSGGGSRGSGSGGSGSGKKAVIELTDSNFEKTVIDSDDIWLVEFYAPWCGHCKRLEPEWESAASQLEGKVKLGALDADSMKVMGQKFGIQGFPTIKFFRAGKKTFDSAEEFTGGRTADDIVKFGLDLAAENLPAPEIVEVSILLRLSSSIVLARSELIYSSCYMFMTSSQNFKVNPVNKPSITKGEDFNEACKKQLCVVSFLPHILDCQSECRNKHLKMLKNVAETFKKNVWGWLWAEGGTQSKLEESLGVGGFGYPAMAAVNSRKMKFALLKGSFGDTGITEFLRALAFGRGSTEPIRGAKLPTIEKTEPWDGKDGEMPTEDDDYDKDEL
ncbi:Protein disulfide-isomerase A6 [Nymphon striatum]|nr:Protein disulfide-isomerase A6 [Nymphon striatum]